MIHRWLEWLKLARNALRLAAAVVIFGGLITAGCVWWSADRLEKQGGEEDELGVDSPLDSRQVAWKIEYAGGKPALLMQDLKPWFHGKGLAKTVVIGSVLVATGLFLLTVRRED